MDETTGVDNMSIPLPADSLPALPSDDSPAVPTQTTSDPTKITSPTNPPVESPSTDNLLSLNISPVIKTPVLGTQQAKRRLLAFCQSKLPRPPRVKKPKKPTEDQQHKGSSPSVNPDTNSTNADDETKAEDKPPAKKSKKGLNSVEKAKAVIEEIELIKKAENDFIEAVNRGLFNSPKVAKRSKTRSRSRERKYKRSKHRSSDSHLTKHASNDSIKYPTCWTEIIKNNYDYDKIKQLRAQMNKNEHSCNDYRKQLLFESPGVPLNPLTYRGINGEEKTSDFQKIRFTKSQPTVSYSDNVQIDTLFFTRKQILSYIPRSFRTTLEKFCNNVNVTLCAAEPMNSKSRCWYPRVLNLDERDTTLGASLVNYSDADENFEETEEVREDAPEKHSRDSDGNKTPPLKKAKEKKKKKTRDEETPKTTKTKRKSRKLKKKSRKLKTKEKLRRRKDRGRKKIKSADKIKATTTSTPPETCDSDHDDKTEKKRTKTTSDTKNKKKAEPVEKTKQEKRTERCKTDSEVPTVADAPKKKSVGRSKRSKSKEEVVHKHDTSTPKTTKTIATTGAVNEKDKSPDTDEYHSHWESEDDVVGQERPSKHNRSWESDEDTFERSSSWNFTKKEYVKSPERSLEMPLNICKPFRRDVKPLPEGIMVQVNNVINTVAVDIPPITMEKSTIVEATNGDFNEKLKETTEVIVEENKTTTRKRKKCRWGDEDDVSTKLPIIGDFVSDSIPEHFDPVKIKAEMQGEEAETSISSSQPNVLENEYEEFMKSLTSDTSKEETTTKKRKERSSSSSSSSDESDSSSDSSTSSSSSDTSSSEDHKKKKPKSKAIDEFTTDLDILPKDVALSKSLIGFTDVPLPVPSPSEKAIPLIPLQIPVASNIIKMQEEAAKVVEFDRTKPLNLSSLALPDKKLLKKSVLEEDVDSNNSDEDEKYPDKKSAGEKTNDKTTEDSSHKNHVPQSDCAKKDSSGKSNVKERNDSPPKSRRGEGSQKRRDSSQRRRDVSPRRRDASPPRRRDVSPRRRTPPRRSRRRDSSHPSQKRRESSERRRDLSPKRREPSPRRSRRHESPPTRRRDSPPPRRRDSGQKRRRSASPNHDISPRRFDITRRSASPRHKRRHSPSVDRNRSSKSPINSPLDGFKRSVADSTISDDLLPQHNVNDYLDSPIYNSQYYRGAPVTQSPKRISLDDRINQVLGIDKEAPKPIGTTYDQANYNPQYYQQYEHYNYVHPSAGMYPECKYEMPRATTSQQGPVNKVVQVGNVLHVMPAENIQPSVNTPKIVQVGNVLEIVPTATIEMQPHPQTKEVTSAEDLMKQKNAERRAEHEKRRQARELRRKEKERKRKEKEKRKQMKIKLKTENMIKRALLLESMDDDENENKDSEEVATAQWPPVPIIITNTASKPAGKGILISHGFSENKSDSSEAVKKTVKFADGVNPGEGTSPSGGEELSSPPPPKATLPKEKRYKKTKISKKIKPKKKKIKVKIIRKSQENEGDDSDEDNLPPPSPPPGSPPPHVFPPRIKTHTINNVHLNYVNTVINASMAPPPPPPSSTVQNTNPNYPSAYRPVMPVMMTAPLPHGHLSSAHHLQAPHGHMHATITHRLPGPHHV